MNSPRSIYGRWRYLSRKAMEASIDENVIFRMHAGKYCKSDVFFYTSFMINGKCASLWFDEDDEDN